MTNDRSRAYQTVAERRSVLSRYKDGTRAIIQEEDSNDGDVIWISKTQNSLDSLQWEFECLAALQESGLVPEIDLDLGCDGRFYMTRVGHAATLAEFAEATSLGEIPVALFREICTVAVDTLEQFWDLGWAHGDLHGRNLVVALTPDNQWQVPIIDLEFATTPDGESPPVEQAIIDTPEGDRDRLLEDLYRVATEFNGSEPLLDVLSLF
ncbi:hypothetical protein VZG28_06405 [Synechococcus elongatus IITB4]|uniref:hypothetical protein n=1 Tax=Synechococcus elongatus TaxID=32046 RepID=UPI0030D2CFCD